MSFLFWLGQVLGFGKVNISRSCFLSRELVRKIYPLGQYIITNTPNKDIMPPMISNLSGITLSIPHPHKIERTTNTPPYAA